MPRRRTKRSSGKASQQSVGVSKSSTTSKKDRRTSAGFQQRFVDVLGWGIFVSFIVGLAVDMSGLVPDWDLPAGIWGLMTIVTSAAFVAQAMKKEPED